MNNELQNKEQMQDEELYALLDRALNDDRLQVSEELIQKTMQRVKEEADHKVISINRTGGKRYRWISYAGMAAAAALVLFVGIKTAGSGGFSVNDVKPESMSARLAEPENGDGNALKAAEGGATIMEDTADCVYFYSVSEESEAKEPSDASERGVFQGLTDEDGTEKSSDARGYHTAVLPEALRNSLFGSNYEKTAMAECWELNRRGGNWQEDLMEELSRGTVEQGLPEEGAYDYVLTCGDGTVQTVKAETALDLIVRIETESGILWGFFGETVRTYWEG